MKRQVERPMHWIPGMGGRPVCGTFDIGPVFTHNTDFVTCEKCRAWFPEWYVEKELGGIGHEIDDLPF